MMKKAIFLSAAFALCIPLGAKDYKLGSPSGNLEVNLSAGETTTWTLSVNGNEISAGNRIALTLADGRVLGDGMKVSKATAKSENSVIEAPFWRNDKVSDCYNSLTLKTRCGYSLELRAYDDAFAYRFVTSMKDSIEVKTETIEFKTGDYDRIVLLYPSPKDYKYECSFEAPYTFIDKGDEIDPSKVSCLPALVDKGSKGKFLLTESDLLDYPGQFLTLSDEGFSSFLPPIPTAFKYSKRYNQRRTAFADIVAKLPGNTLCPWRVVAYAAQDKDLPTNDIVYKLATPSRLDDISWVKPGLSTWDWWNAFKLTGVDFKSGINTATYKYHIDFAADYGLPYVLLDEGWYKAPDIMNPIPELDLPELCHYAASKGVRLVLWSTMHLVGLDAEKVMSHYAEMGIAGFKLDFIEAQDQLSVKLLTYLAQTAAKNRLVLDFHGVYKPAGLTRTYPNVLNFEGVFGLEQIGKETLDMPLNDVTIPYLRMVQGPIDYTPGGIDCSAKDENLACGRGRAVQGTRAHQVAAYIVFDSPYGMMCDSPSKYRTANEMARFIGQIPTVFDKTSIQSGKIGESIVTVRSKEDRWYVGGMTNWDGRDVDVSFSFLPEGKFKASVFRDGMNSDRVGNDYKTETLEVSKDTVIPVHMAPGGGFAIVVSEK